VPDLFPTSQKSFSFISPSREKYQLIPFENAWADQLISWIHSKKDLLFWSGKTFEQGFSRSLFERHLKRKNLYSFSLLNKDKHLLAYGEIVRTGLQSCTLCRVMVHPDRRGEGIGKIFCKLVMQWASEEMAFKKMHLNVLGCNKSAIRCYRSVGFTITMVKRNARVVDQDTHDLFYMATSL